MKRNPKATCANCPYWAQSGDPISTIDELKGLDKETLGRCHQTPYSPRKTAFQWCGQHPDFPKDPD